MGPEKEKKLTEGDSDLLSKLAEVFRGKIGAILLCCLPAGVIVVGVPRAIEEGNRQCQVFSQVTRDCLSRALSAKGVPSGVCEPLSADDFAVWQSCVNDGKQAQKLNAYPFEPDDEAYSEAVRAVESGK